MSVARGLLHPPRYPQSPVECLMNVKLVSAIAAGLLVVGFSAPTSAQYRDRDRGYSDGSYA